LAAATAIPGVGTAITTWYVNVSNALG